MSFSDILLVHFVSITSLIGKSLLIVWHEQLAPSVKLMFLLAINLYLD